MPRIPFRVLADRFAALLPWLNDEPLPDLDRRLRDVLLFSPEAGIGEEPMLVPQPLYPQRAITPQAARQLRSALLGLVDYVVPRVPTSGPPAHPYMPRLESLRFDVHAWRKPPGKRSQIPASARPAQGGQFAVLLVSGRLTDLVLFQAVRLLTGPRPLLLGRCPAPAVGGRGETCGRVLVVATARRGRPATFCSASCRLRAHRA